MLNGRGDNKHFFTSNETIKIHEQMRVCVYPQVYLAMKLLCIFELYSSLQAKSNQT